MEVPSLHRLLQLDGASLGDGSILLSLHPDGSRLAAARGPVLCICPLLPASSSQKHVSKEGLCQVDRAVEGEDGQREQALRDRQATHGSAGPHSHAAGQGLPLRFTCRAASGPPTVSSDDITALAWLAFARPPSAATNAPPVDSQEERTGGGAGSGGGGDGSPVSQVWQGRSASSRRRTNSSGASGSLFASIQVMMEDHELQQQQQAQKQQASSSSSAAAAAAAAATATAVGPQHAHSGYSLVFLLSGTRGGALQLHHAESGVVLLRQQLHPAPVVSIAVRTWRMGLNPTDAVEDVTVGWANAVARLAAWELRAAATTCYAAYAAAEARLRGGSSGSGGGTSRFSLWGSSSSWVAPTGPDVRPLAVQKWEVPAGAAQGRTSVVCCGQRPRDLYSLLQHGVGSSSPTATGKTIFLAAGSRPSCLAALEVDEQPSGGGALSYISSMATGVWGLARTARHVAMAPLSIRDGIKSLVMNPLQLVGGGGAAAGGALAGAAPLASFPDTTAGQRLPCTGIWRHHRDDGRVLLSLAPAPHGSLVAAVDNLGRLLLVEVGAMLVSRMWKGYRDAQIGWMEVQAHHVAKLLHRRHQLEAGGEHECERAHQPTRMVQMEGSQYSTQVAVWSSCDDSVGERSASQESQSAAKRGEGRSVREDGAVRENGGEHVLLLVVYAPRRQVLELWFPLHGERVAAVGAPPKGRLLQRGGGGPSGGGELGTWRVADAASAASPPMTPTGCMMCFTGQVPNLGLGLDLEPASADDRHGLELLDVATVFGLG